MVAQPAADEAPSTPPTTAATHPVTPALTLPTPYHLSRRAAQEVVVRREALETTPGGWSLFGCAITTASDQLVADSSLADGEDGELFVPLRPLAADGIPADLLASRVYSWQPWSSAT